ncbi:hypothetical protein [Alicyclobacillus sp. ALC3]|nr:hypothetical protein [Alicyclobacillus sp. ALC3]WDL98109.1 hypothetical protein JC200_05255 [Alicyclobacillus sp. ALC3]
MTHLHGASEVNAITSHIATTAQDLGVKVTQKEIKDALQTADAVAQAIP